MSESFPLVVKPMRGSRGPRRQEGERYASGDLKRRGPNEKLLEQRRALADDLTMGENPLDAAFSNGWLGRAEYKAAVRYVMLHRQAKIGGPRTGVANYGEADPIDPDCGAEALVDLTNPEIAAIWDEVFSRDASDTAEAQEAREAAAMAKLRIIHAEMTREERAEVHLVCVQESWPQWFIHRRAGENLRAKARNEKRALTDDELAYIAKKFATGWEGKRTLLISGLRAITRALAPAQAADRLLPRAERSAPAPREPAVPRSQGFRKRTVEVE